MNRHQDLKMGNNIGLRQDTEEGQEYHRLKYMN